MLVSNRSLALVGLLTAIVLSNLVPVFAKTLYSQGLSPASVYLAILLVMCGILGSHELISLEERSWHWNMSRSDFWGTIVAAVTGGVLDPLLFFSGLRFVQASEAILLSSLLPFFVVCFAVLMLGERFTRQTFIGGMIIISGIIVLLWENIVSFRFSGGALLIIGASLCSALTVIIHKKYINHNRTDTIIFLRTVVAALIVIIWVQMTEPESFSHFATTDYVWSFLGLSVGGFLLPYLFYYHSLRHLKAMDAGILSAIGRALSIVLASLTLHESIGALRLLSLLLVISGGIIINVPLTHRRIVPERLPNVGPLRR
ncbi:MAG TPA: DMT family transporter [Candidatus Peribacteraceae bacterium]|nr:DMT family transporter [Candidatus Peribacteraceae bacterium]